MHIRIMPTTKWKSSKCIRPGVGVVAAGDVDVADPGAGAGGLAHPHRAPRTGDPDLLLAAQLQLQQTLLHPLLPAHHQHYYYTITRAY